MSIEWPDFASITDPVEQLAALTRYYGQNPEFVLAGGGNSAVKLGETLHVKASGTAMATIAPAGFVSMDRPQLDALMASEMEDDEDAREKRFKEATLTARLHPELGQRPSVESVLHHILPGTFTVHTHPTWLNMLTCAKGGEAIANELYGDTILWLPYTTPGFVLAKALDDALKAYTERTGRETPDAVIMGNHGLILGGNTPEEIREKTDAIITLLKERIGTLPEDAFGAKTLAQPEATWVRSIGPALRAQLADGPILKVVTFDDTPIVQSVVCGADGEATVAGGPLNPDQIVYCKSFPLWHKIEDGESPETSCDRLAAAVQAYRDDHGYPPHVILVEGLGMFTAGDTYSGACTVREVYKDSLQVMAGARILSAVQHMTVIDREFIESWEVEAYRRKVAAAGKAAGRVEGKIILVTGAAQGFGHAIAEGLAQDAATVVLADLNAEGAIAAAEALGNDKALGVAMNVTDPDSVAEAMDNVIRTYGGIDCFVSNAGVLKAESVKTQSKKDFQFVTEVNYTGYFVSVQQAAPILALQYRYAPEYRSDIIQINSKSGLVGSNRNGAYAGSKFGGIGLTQSFALELIEDGVKVNSICPGNFFDGPLWSNPENGLFVQYLNTGKVPGAKTIEDVKRFYEEKVPMGRGCEAQDVLRAIFYLMEQQYETGQALPVTGGQVMLSS